MSTLNQTIAGTTYLPPARSIEAGYLRRVWRAVRGIVNEMNYATERVTTPQATRW